MVPSHWNGMPLSAKVALQGLLLHFSKLYAAPKHALSLAQTFHFRYTRYVKLTAQLKLKPTPEQADALRRTLEAANAACNFISQVAWDTHTFNTFALQKLCYTQVRDTFSLAAQMVIRALSKVADAYRHDTKTKRTFGADAAFAYDDR